MVQMDSLAIQNRHERDSHITFEEGPHIYTIDGESDYMSVTTWNHSHFEEFDADKIIENMMKSRNWPKSKYFGKTPDEIKKQWEDNRDEAASAGTKLHYDIECYYNGVPQENDSVEYQYFLQFESHRDGGLNFRPYRTEWMVWNKDLRFAGSIDMVFENPDGSLLIYDWKRSKEIKKTTPWGRSSHTPCIAHLPDTNFWHYSLQLNTYKALLEMSYGKKVSAMRLVCLHPNNRTYQVYTVPDLHEEVDDLFQLRKSKL
jgi:ATP-dependent exoDNAse (exonuclease V) beta subunit